LYYGTAQETKLFFFGKDIIGTKIANPKNALVSRLGEDIRLGLIKIT
jgi:hypothetical protein